MKKADTKRFLFIYIFVFFYLLLIFSFLASITGHFGFSLKILKFAYILICLGYVLYVYEIKKN